MQYCVGFIVFSAKRMRDRIKINRICVRVGVCVCVCGGRGGICAMYGCGCVWLE